MPVADLHVHTTISDGQLSPEAVPSTAATAGLDAVAITDHDRLQPQLEAPLVTRNGVDVIHGIELRVEDQRSGLRVDLLGYGVSPTSALQAECERLATDRRKRATAMIECLEDRLGIELDIDLFDGIGRPHIARAIASNPNCPHDATDAFQTLIGTGDPCYRARAVPSFERGSKLLSEACSLVGLAHPFRYDDLDTALTLARRLDAIERNYPYSRSVDYTPIDRLLETEGLYPTGGSDAHNRQLGVAGLDQSTYTRFRSQLTTS